MEFMKLAAERYSVRKFKEGHLEQNIIDEILKAGHQCGSMFFSPYSLQDDNFKFTENFIYFWVKRFFYSFFL